MQTPADNLVSRLADALPGSVHAPGTSGYRRSLSRVFFPDASRRCPPCVVHPRDAGDVATAMRILHHLGGTATVRGGGLSSTCVADDAVMLDLSVHLNAVRPHETTVTVDGGATVGPVLEALAPARRVIPVGIVGLAGLGLVTRGGVGYLTRSVGLALDYLVEVELVLPDGEIVRLSDDSQGEEAELWWAVRGCAPCFGIVTSAVLRTIEQGPVFVDRLVVALDALPAYFATAPELPRHTTMGAVLGYVPDAPADPVLLVYTACRSQNDADIAIARAAATAVAAAAKESPLYRSAAVGRYLSGLPEFAIPGSKGQEPEPTRAPEPGEHRGWFYGKSVFTGPTLGDDVASGLQEAIRAAPSPRAASISSTPAEHWPTSATPRPRSGAAAANGTYRSTRFGRTPPTATAAAAGRATPSRCSMTTLLACTASRCVRDFPKQCVKSNSRSAPICRDCGRYVPRSTRPAYSAVTRCRSHDGTRIRSDTGQSDAGSGRRCGHAHHRSERPRGLRGRVSEVAEAGHRRGITLPRLSRRRLSSAYRGAVGLVDGVPIRLRRQHKNWLNSSPPGRSSSTRPRRSSTGPARSR